MRIRIKRVYEPASDDDGRRILVDRLWPRGLSKDKARIDLWLKDEDAGTISFETKHCHGTRNIAALGVEPDVFPGGGLRREVTLARLPDKMSTTRLRVSRRILVSKGRDARLFVRVTQEDGHRAWSSPIYLFR